MSRRVTRDNVVTLDRGMWLSIDPEAHDGLLSNYVRGAELACNVLVGTSAVVHYFRSGSLHPLSSERNKSTRIQKIQNCKNLLIITASLIISFIV